MKKGFTLIEMLVVVLIIGILAGIALPQYQMAVTKAKVASMLPLMRRWKDALAEYKLQHGDYGNETDGYPDGATLGVNWPSDWKSGNNPCDDNVECWTNDGFWNYCFANEEQDGCVGCTANYGTSNQLEIWMCPPDNNYEVPELYCLGYGQNEKVCKSLGWAIN